MSKLAFAGCIFNKEAYVAEAIESLLAQTEKDIEIIYYDDGSTDGTVDIIKCYQMEDDRVKLIQGKKNVGLGIGWGIVTKAVTAPILAVISGDDVWTPDRAEITLKGLNKSVDVFYGSFWNCDAQMNKVEYKEAVAFDKEKLLTPREDGFSTQYMGHFVSAYKTKVGLEVPYRKDRKYGIDYPFFLDLAKKNYRFGWTTKLLGYARQLKSGVSVVHREEILREDHANEKEI